MKCMLLKYRSNQINSIQMPDSLNFKNKYTFYAFSANSKCVSRASIKSRGQGFPPAAIMNVAPASCIGK